MGAKAEFHSGMTIDELGKLTHSKGPVLVGTNVPGAGAHTMIVDKIEGDIVYVRDTLPGGVGARYGVFVQDFGAVWRGTAVT